MKIMTMYKAIGRRNAMVRAKTRDRRSTIVLACRIPVPTEVRKHASPKLAALNVQRSPRSFNCCSQRSGDCGD